MFGIGTPELILILLIFFIFFGPSKLPEIARWMGRIMREFRKVSAEMNKNLQDMAKEIENETGKETKGTASGNMSLTKDLKEISKDIGDMAKEVNAAVGPASGLLKDVREASKETTSVAREARASLNEQQEETPSTSGKEGHA